MQDTAVSDIVLIDLLATGDENAFQEIYRRYWHKLYLIARRKVNTEEDAEEIVQDIFVDLWERRTRLQVNDLDRFLFSSVKYKVLNYIKAHIVRQNYRDDTLNISSESNSDTEDQLAYRDLNEAIMTGVGQLPEKTREVFMLNRLEGLPVKEIADRLQIPTRTVEYHITQSLRTMRVYLKDFVIFSIGSLFCFA